MHGRLEDRLRQSFGGHNLDQTLSNFLLEKLGEEVFESYPVDLDAISDDCGLTVEPKSNLGVSGLILAGEVILDASEIRTRRRFTLAHEIMHFLLRSFVDHFNRSDEEWMCDRGASHILLPHSVFTERYQNRTVSMALARSVSQAFDLSLLGSLTSLALRGSHGAIVAIWSVTADEALRLRWQVSSGQLEPDTKLILGLELSRSKKVCRWAAGDSHYSPPDEIVVRLPHGKIRYACEFLPYGSRPGGKHILSVLHPRGHF